MSCESGSTLRVDPREGRPEGEGMIKICAWHPRHFGTDLQIGETGPATHGMCEDCYRLVVGEEPPADLAPFGRGRGAETGDTAGTAGESLSPPAGA